MYIIRKINKNCAVFSYIIITYYIWVIWHFIIISIYFFMSIFDFVILTFANQSATRLLSFATFWTVWSKPMRPGSDDAQHPHESICDSPFVSRGRLHSQIIWCKFLIRSNQFYNLHLSVNWVGMNFNNL